MTLPACGFPDTSGILTPAAAVACTTDSPAAAATLVATGFSEGHAFHLEFAKRAAAARRAGGDAEQPAFFVIRSLPSGFMSFLPERSQMNRTGSLTVQRNVSGVRDDKNASAY